MPDLRRAWATRAPVQTLFKGWRGCEIIQSCKIHMVKLSRSSVYAKVIFSQRGRGERRQRYIVNVEIESFFERRRKFLNLLDPIFPLRIFFSLHKISFRFIYKNIFIVVYGVGVALQV